MKIKTILVNFIPIFLLFGLLSYTEKFIHISGSVLGKLFAVFIILFYTTIDILHGVLATSLIILYYQSDIVESMMNMYEYKGTQEINKEEAEDINDPILLPVIDSSQSYLSQYENTTMNHNHLSKKEMKHFRKQHCKKGHLVSKDQNIPIDMIEHVYPEVSFINDKCNICDSTCNFTVSETIISACEKEGFAPISCRN